MGNIVLPEIIDKWRNKRNGKRRYVGQVLLFGGREKPVVIAEVYGDSIEQMRDRKHVCCEALKALENNRTTDTDANP